MKARERGESEGTKYRKGRLKGLREGESEGKEESEGTKYRRWE